MEQNTNIRNTCNTSEYINLSNIDNEENKNSIFENLYDITNDSERSNIFTPFSNSKVRKKFVTKIFCIITTIQLFSCITSIIFYNSNSFKNFVYSDKGITFSCLSGILLISILIFLINFPEFGKYSPSNYILLIIISLIQAYSYCLFNILKDAETFNSVIYANLLISGFLCLLSYQNKIDFTDFSMMFFSIIIAVTFIVIRDLHFKIVIGHTLLGCFISILNIIYTIYDIQYTVSDNRMNEYDEYDHVFAVLTLYFDVFNLIVYLLKKIKLKLCN